MQTHRKEYVEQEIIGRFCGICGSNKTTINKKRNKKGILYESLDWRLNPLDKNIWLCRTCYNRVKYYKIKKW